MTGPRFTTSDIAVALAAGVSVLSVNTGWIPVPNYNFVLLVVIPLVVGGIAIRRPSLLLVAFLVLVNSRSAHEVAVLSMPQPSGAIAGLARMVTDPEVSKFDIRAVVDLDGRRYVASVPLELGHEFKSLNVDDEVLIRGVARPLDGAPRGWVLSNHLGGRLSVSSVEKRASGHLWYRVANGLRTRIERSANSMESQERALYLGLVIGDDRNQSELQEYRFKAAGISHLLAVSGQNVAFVLMLASPLLGRLGPRASLLMAIPLLVVFALVTRAEPSVLRAVVMATISLFAVAFDHPANGLRVLSITVMFLLLVDPLIAFSIGFQLSSIATAGLIVLAKPIAGRTPGPNWISQPLALTLAAQLATAPIIFGFNSTIPYVAPLTNLLAVPASGLVMMVGLTGGLVTGSVHAQVGVVVLYPIRWVLRWIDWIAEVGSRLPVAPLTPLRFVMVSLILGFMLAASHVAIAQSRRSTNLIRCLGIAGLVILGVPWGPSAGQFKLDGDAAVWLQLCDSGALIVKANTDPIAVLGSMAELHLTSLDTVITDDTPSARAAAMTIARQHATQRTIHLQRSEVNRLIAMADLDPIRC